MQPFLAFWTREIFSKKHMKKNYLVSLEQQSRYLSVILDVNISLL